MHERLEIGSTCNEPWPYPEPMRGSSTQSVQDAKLTRMENVDNLMIEHLKRFQGGQDRVERKLDQIGRRLGNLEAGKASIIQHIGHLASVEAQQQVQADDFAARLERIERRLELA